MVPIELDYVDIIIVNNKSNLVSIPTNYSRKSSLEPYIRKPGLVELKKKRF